jgi:hypothetical protein
MSKGARLEALRSLFKRHKAVKCCEQWRNAKSYFASKYRYSFSVKSTLYRAMR